MTLVRDIQQSRSNITPSRSRRQKSTADRTLERENELARLIQAGDEIALVEVYERFLQPVYSYFYRQTSNELQAEDLTSATFLQALQGFHASVTLTIGCGPWLFGIAQSLLSAWRTDTLPVPLTTAELETRGQHVLDEILAQEQLYLLWHLVDRLPLACQQVLILRYKDDLSYMEIALQMKSTVNKCKTLHGQAMKKLRDIVRKEYAGMFPASTHSPFKDP